MQERDPFGSDDRAVIADIAFGIDDPRHRHWRNAGMARHIVDGDATDAQSVRDLLLRAPFALASVGQKQDAGARLDTSGGVTRACQGTEMFALLVSQGNEQGLAHALQFNTTLKYSTG